ncbi:MAG: class II aldolase/adducin family protein [Smithellaceae bacterium]|nr:class II aldolase/adducin family protein [Smithellaceae bacterium]
MATKLKFNRCRKDVLDASIWLSRHGYFGSSKGSGGNVSVRIDDKTMAVTPSGVAYRDMSNDDICIIGLDLTTHQVKSNRTPSMESGMHSIIYRKRPDVKAIVHTHQIYGSVFALINTPIPSLFDEVSLSLGPVIEIVPYAFSGSETLARNVGRTLAGGANACIIQNHGIVALGRTLDEAILHAELLEKVANIYCLALSTGKPVTILPESSIRTIARMRKAQVVKK